MASASALRPVVHSIPPSQPSFFSSRSLAFEFGVRKCLILFSSNNNCKNLFSSNNNCRKVRALAATRREKDMDIHSASSTSSPAGAKKPFGVLFVCLGNICRSPTAEAVFRKAVEKRKLESLFEIDSAGTINYHEGNPADPRMKAAAKKRGIDITSISRPIQPTDFQKFDIILAMDRQNKADIVEAFDDWKEKYALPPNALKKEAWIPSNALLHIGSQERQSGLQI
eukprot:TRINITY_DN430_c0_g1_i1.p1 TRINITY_DN430_c0_g1~~TRINITY_DN430_c0_g1_i1.p1  ORF type:complete len:226 (-),score=41.45 TRINITY_DN430_c0_g1_i1:277-954(-)